MTSRLQSGHDLQLLSNPSLWLCAVAAAFTMATTAHAANSPDDVQPPANAESMTPKQAYDHDKAYCNSQQATEQRSLCLKEAARAYQEARAGKLEPTTTASSTKASTTIRIRSDHFALPHRNDAGRCRGRRARALLHRSKAP